ncbi:putative uncharacterized protein [Clostridium sp. CAG:288]|jgi:HSP20 family protein|nr:putative uncharacterized protein [Clostridium sp. CAG:288]HCY67684.1 Hsp20/alpha crystallin family protein [Bacillota bacterium]
MKNELRERNYYGLRDSLFDNIFFPYEHKENNMMKTDVKENENDYELQVEVPGVNKENISIDYENGYVTIAAKTNKSKDEKDKEGNYIRRERYSGSYSRSYYVGDVDRESIKAKLDNGVLSIIVPKAKAEEQKKAIAIE